jgi:putative peptide zinc metalloprotease protein
MTESFLSPSWHLVEHLRPRLQPHSEITRQHIRGQTGYVIRNPATGRTYRFSQNVYLVLALLDGRRTVAEAWSVAAQQLGDAAPTQNETIRLLAQLHDADLVQSDKAPEIAELMERSARHTRMRWLQALGNPLSLRFPIWDPDRFLTITLPFVRALFGRFGVILWLAVVIPSLVIAASHWSELSENLSDRLLATENLFLIALIYPFVKALHELGHAYTVKAGGGDVHEIGLMFLVMLPIPYVDASAANAFRSKWRRAGVSAAGIMVETFIAAIALQVWLLTEPGLVRAVAFNTMALAGVSTVLFNGNPLLRFDGYFILCDVAGAPNLAGRAAAYWGWLVERYAFGRLVEPPVTTPGERKLFLFYAPTSITYRLFITAAVALFIAERVLFIGVVIAIWGVVSSIVVPVCRWSWKVTMSPTLASVRGRALGVSFAALLVAFATLGLVPMPLHTVAEGVIWLPEQSIVRAGADGFVTEFLAQPGSVVRPGTQLLRSEDRDLEATLLVHQARVAAATARLGTQERDNPQRTEVARRALAVETSALAQASEFSRELEVKSKSEGIFVVPRADDLLGRFYRRGDVLGYVATPSKSTARVLVRQDDVDLVRRWMRGAKVRMSSQMSQVFTARLVREVPAASTEFPSVALTLEGGGSQAADPTDRDVPRALNRLFQFDIELSPVAARSAVMGEHVWVRFYHGVEPLAFQWWRRLRQLFLSRFNA